jgi:hypothetical protein
LDAEFDFQLSFSSREGTRLIQLPLGYTFVQFQIPALASVRLEWISNINIKWISNGTIDEVLRYGFKLQVPQNSTLEIDLFHLENTTTNGL